MTKTNKPTKSLHKQRLFVVLMISLLLMASSFSVAYFNSQPSPIADTIDCSGDTERSAVSADGLVVAPEADLRCAGEVNERTSSQELTRSVSVLIGTVSTLLTLVLLSLLLSRKRQL